MKKTGIRGAGGAATVLLAAALWLSAGVVPVLAACTPQANHGVIATCSGVTNGQAGGAPGASGSFIGYGTAVEFDVTVNVLPGATVTATEFGIWVDGIKSLTNNGSITGTIGGSVGIESSTIIQSLANSGVISGVFAGVRSTTITSLSNSGSITGTVNDGIAAIFGNITSLTNSGFISGGGNGISATNSTITSLSNSGSITGGDRGIRANTIGSLSNSGSITGTADTGIFTNGTITSLTNSGVISGVNRGIEAGSITSLINSGSISGTGGFSTGIISGTITSLSNSGSITGGLEGIHAVGSIGTLTNSGSISGNLSGIDADSITSLTNSGSISGVSFGIFAGSSITSLTNSGLISGGSPAGVAIQKSTGDTQLTLLAGSVLVGQVNLGGGTNTLNVGAGLSMATTFNNAAPMIGSMSVPFVVNGNQVITADTTSLANQSTMLADLTGGIFSAVENRLDNLRGGVSSFAQPMALAYDEPVAARSGPFAGFGPGSGSVDRSRQVWMQAFGSFRQQEGTSSTLGSQQRLGGFVSGMDVGSGPNRAGIFFGGSGAAAQVDVNAGKTTADSFFGGAYASTQMNGTFVDLAFTAGYSSFDRERRVANNQVIGGIETASADYHGWFVSPEVRFMRPWMFGGQKLEQSLTLRYAGLFLDGFNESGVTTGALNVGSRDIHLGIARAALALPLTRMYSDGAQARWIYTAGIEGRTQFGGDNVSGTLAGQGIAFNAGGRQSAVGLFGSYRAELASPLGHTMYALVEGLAESDGSYQLSGKAGFRVRY